MFPFFVVYMFKWLLGRGVVGPVGTSLNDRDI